MIIERQAVTGDMLCGGFLSWATLRRLKALGISSSELGGHDVAALRVFAGKRGHAFALPGPALGLSRRRLDGLLLDRAEQLGANVRRGTVAIGLGREGLRLDSGEIVRSRSLFLATGKHDLRGLVRPREAAGEDPMLGLRLRLPPSNRLTELLGNHVEMHLFASGYLGLVLQEDGSANACMAVRKSRLAQTGGNPAALFEQLAHDSPALADRFAALSLTLPIDAIGHLPYGWRARGTKPGIFRLGDQAGVMPSLAGEGISLALASAEWAVRHWARGDGAAAPAYQRAFARRLRRPLALAGMIAGLGQRPAMARVAAALLSGVPGAAGMLARMTRV